MANLGKVVILVVAVGLGYSLGSCGEPVETKTEVKVVKVPVVKTNTVTKEVRLPYPPSCTMALDAARGITEEDAVQTEAVGEILLALQAMSTAAAFDDVKKVNELTALVRKQGAILDESVQNRVSAVSTYETYILKCRDELKGDSN